MLEVKTVPPDERTVRWGAALSQESEAEPRLETLQGRRAGPPSWPVMLYSPISTLYQHYINTILLIYQHYISDVVLTRSSQHRGGGRQSGQSVVQGLHQGSLYTVGYQHINISTLY